MQEENNQFGRSVSFTLIVKKNEKMNKNLLFAIDAKTEEVIVSDSPKGSNNINFIERIGRSESEILYNAAVTLTSISRAVSLDVAIFKAMDKVCQMIYNKHKETSR